jgi:hypothetical protein
VMVMVRSSSGLDARFGIGFSYRCVLRGFRTGW